MLARGSKRTNCADDDCAVTSGALNTLANRIERSHQGFRAELTPANEAIRFARSVVTGLQTTLNESW
jgi:hypothetical protein